MEGTRQKCEVKIQYGSYSETVTVYCDADDDNEAVKRKAWKQVDANFLSMASQSAKVLSREDYYGE